MNKTTYRQLKDLPDSPKGCLWVTSKSYEGIFFTEESLDRYAESYLIDHPDFWEKEETKRWKPEEEDTYLYISDIGRVTQGLWYNGYINNYRYDVFNCFEFESEAERVAKLTRELWKKEASQ